MSERSPAHRPSRWRPRRCTTKSRKTARGNSSPARVLWPASSQPARRRNLRRCHEPFVLVRREDLRGPRRGTEWLGQWPVPPDGGRSARLGVRKDRDRDSARRFPVCGWLRATHGRRAARRIPRHPRGCGRALPPPDLRAGHYRLAALDRCRQGPAAAKAGDHVQDRGRSPQYTVTIRKWNLAARLPDALFVFTPPEGASRVDVLALVGRAEPPAGGAR